MTVLDEAFARRTRAEWADRFAELDVWWTPVNSAGDLLDDPQAQAVGVFVDIPGAGEGETARSVATPATFDTGIGPTAGPPAIGADTVEVLRELGVDDDECRRLREAGVVHAG